MPEADQSPKSDEPFVISTMQVQVKNKRPEPPFELPSMQIRVKENLSKKNE